MTIKMTLNRLLRAVEKNGFNKGTRGYTTISREEGIVEACSLGQAALNLNITPYWLGRAVQKFDTANNTTLWKDITMLNDYTKLSPQEIARFIRVKYTTFLHDTLDVDIVRG